MNQLISNLLWADDLILFTLGTGSQNPLKATRYFEQFLLEMGR